MAAGTVSADPRGIEMFRHSRTTIRLPALALVVAACAATAGPSASPGSQTASAPVALSSSSPSPSGSATVSTERPDCADLPAGTIRTVAGSGPEGENDTEFYEAAGDGGPALQAKLDLPTDVVIDREGNLFILEHAAHPPRFNPARIRKVDPSGRITTVVGPFAGDGQEPNGEAATFDLGRIGLGIDPAGYPLFTGYGGDGSPDNGGLVMTLGSSGRLELVAGTGVPGFSGDGGPAVEAQVGYVSDMAYDRAGNLYLADGTRVRRVDPDGVITTIAGTGDLAFTGDGVPAIQAGMNPVALAFSADGSLYLADYENARIRMIDPTGIIQTVAGTGDHGYNGDGNLAAATQVDGPEHISIDREGRLLISDYSNRIRRLEPDGTIVTIAGTGQASLSADGGLAVRAALDGPGGMAIGPDGAIYLAEFEGARVRLICP